MQMIQKTSFSSGFHFFYDSEWNRGRQRKIKYYFSIHELIVRNLGTIQLQFVGGWGWGGLRYKSLLEAIGSAVNHFTLKLGAGVGKQINLI